MNYSNDNSEDGVLRKEFVTIVEVRISIVQLYKLLQNLVAVHLPFGVVLFLHLNKVMIIKLGREYSIKLF